MTVGAWRRGSSVVLLALGGLGGGAMGQSDDCAGAPPLPMGVVRFTQFGYSPDGEDQCWNGVADGWQAFTAPADGMLVLDGQRLCTCRGK